MEKIEALFISDVHLGSKGSNAEAVLSLLKKYEPETLFLVGDIIDGWLLKRKFRWPQSHTNVIRKILSYSKNDTKVIYIPGNHDEFIREYLEFSFGNIEVHNEYIWKKTYYNWSFDMLRIYLLLHHKMHKKNFRFVLIFYKVVYLPLFYYYFF
jgi:UDP-2,3-diacylglucosamine pyrophosphatase LpxH